MPNNDVFPSEVLDLAAEIRAEACVHGDERALEVIDLAAEIRAEARAHGDDLALDDAIVKAWIRLPDLLVFGAEDDTWIEAEAAKVEALLDTLHDALDGEVARLVSAA